MPYHPNIEIYPSGGAWYPGEGVPYVPPSGGGPPPLFNPPGQGGGQPIGGGNLPDPDIPPIGSGNINPNFGGDDNYPSPGGNWRDNATSNPRESLLRRIAALHPLGRLTQSIQRALQNRSTDWRRNAQSSSGRSGSSGPAPWYSSNYRLPSGLQEAMRRGDYDSAYGQSGSSQEAARIMAMGGFTGGLTRHRTIGSRVADEVQNVGPGGGLSHGGRTTAEIHRLQQDIGIPLHTDPASGEAYMARLRQLGLLPEDQGAGWGMNG